MLVLPVLTVMTRYFDSGCRASATASVARHLPVISTRKAHHCSGRLGILTDQGEGSWELVHFGFFFLGH